MNINPLEAAREIQDSNVYTVGILQIHFQLTSMQINLNRMDIRA